VPSGPTGADSLLVTLFPCSALLYGCPRLFALLVCAFAQSLKFCPRGALYSSCEGGSQAAWWLGGGGRAGAAATGGARRASGGMSGSLTLFLPLFLLEWNMVLDAL
jgi:hypothetical protein